MSETEKPAWVKALEEAAVVLQSANKENISPGERDSKTRVAYGWIDVARTYKDVNLLMPVESQF